MSLIARLRVLVRPELPEPIDDAQWRRLYRMGIGVPIALALFNVSALLFVDAQYRAEYFTFLSIILPSHLMVVLISAASLKWPAGARARRASMYALIPLVLWTAICGMFMDEAIATNSVLVMVAIAFFRTALDGGLGFFAVLSACVLQGALWLVIYAGVVHAISVTAQRSPRASVSDRFTLYTVAWQLLAYWLAWLLASYVANRFRALSHAVAVERQIARGKIAEVMANAGHGRLTGQVLGGRYLMKELLGRGGMGEVYDAARIDDSQNVAVKVLFPHLMDSPHVLERFKREAVAARRLAASCAAEVLDSSVAEDGSPYIVMERLRGEDLAAVLRRRGQLPLEEMRRLLDRLARSLDAVHAQGIVHRDLKPSNVFILDDGDARILDFGIARLLDTPVGETLTGDHAVLGSPGFFAPEQARGNRGEIGPWTDVFALGAITYRALTGHNAFPARNAADALLQALQHHPPPPSTLRPDLPPQIDQVLALALAKRRDQRYARASELADDFARACDGTLAVQTAARAAALDAAATARNDLEFSPTVTKL